MYCHYLDITQEWILVGEEQ